VDNEFTDDALGPGRTGLKRGRDDDIVLARFVEMPAPAIQVMVAVHTARRGQFGEHANLLVTLLIIIEYEVGKNGSLFDAGKRQHVLVEVVGDPFIELLPRVLFRRIKYTWV
jgi:hypothetical protein